MKLTAMESCNNNSKICEFYKDKHILLTGATGVLGKLIFEKLLRVCRPAMIYLIIRTKKLKDPHHRLKELTESRLFHRLKKEDPDFMKRLKIVSGDVSEPGLGLSSADAEFLSERVQIVFHGAATVKFDEMLSTATMINVRGTKAILELCKKMKNLESVVHISTAYSHCPRKEIREEFYETPITSEGLIALAENLSPKLLNQLTPSIIGEWNNTYVFTKAVAEETVRKNGVGLPLSIMRPGIITTTRSEPIPHWVDNCYGPIGMTAGCYSGIIHVVLLSKDGKGELIPADMAVNCLLAVGYKTAKSRNLQEIPIYHLTSHPQNTITWTGFFNLMKERAIEIPHSQTIWYYPSIFVVRSRFYYYLLAFFLHILPAIVIDIGYMALQKKPRLLKLYNKVHTGMDLLGYFSTNSWKFTMNNMTDLWNSLDDVDKKLFDFDMESLDYKSFIKGSIDGIRIYLLKDEGKDMTWIKKRFFIISVIDHIMKIIILSGLLWCSWRIFTSVANFE